MHKGVIFSHEKEQNHVIFKKMDERGDHHVKGSKPTQKDKYHICSVIYRTQIFKTVMKVKGQLFWKRRVTNRELEGKRR
jgi:hypothetical protein